MAPVPDTPHARVRSSARPPRRHVSGSAPPKKKLKYIPGGPGGGGRYVDDAGIETPVGGTGPGGYAYTGPRGRIGRLNAERQGLPLPAPTPSFSRPRRQTRPSAGPRSSSAAAVAAAVAQSDGYKPREERTWDEFHPDLDIEAEFPVYSAEQIDGASPADTQPATPLNPASTGQHAVDTGLSTVLDGLRAQQVEIAEQEPVHANTANPLEALVTPKRRPGRPPRNKDSMLAGLGSPPRPRINPLPTMNPREKLNLPKPSVRQVDTFKAHEQSEGVKVNYVDRTMASIGYQESEVFARPEHGLIRLPQGSIEEDLDLTLQTEADNTTVTVPVGRVEYDMDEQDDRWLDALNLQRKEEGIEAIKPAIFEVTITQIEKEWHALEKRIPKPNPKPPQTHRPRSSSAAAVNGEPVPGEEQDTKCAICDDGDCENTNAIVFCDGCDLAVHQECYGVPFIPEGQWLCRRCQLVGRGTPASELPGCIFCPNVDGAFKQTTTMKWAHLLCAMWIPEVSLGNVTFQEPVQDVEKVPKTRWKLSCYICKQKMGACIQCGHKSCFEAFHVTCARRARLCLRMKSSQAANPQDTTVLKAFCDRHSPSDWRRENDIEGAVADAKAYFRHTLRNIRWPDSQAFALSLGSSNAMHSTEGADEDDTPGSNKRKRGQPAKSWRLPSGAPVVPQTVYHNVENSLIRFNVRKRKEFVQEACKYWTLKREARRGAALLKRLQLQMEAFSSMEITRRNFAGMGAAGRPRLQRRIEFAERLEDDMEQIRVLCEQVKQREEEKLKDALILKDIIDCIYFPIPRLLEPILQKVAGFDSRGVFTEGLSDLQAKLDQRFYTSVQAFNEDLAAVLSGIIDFTAPVTTIGDANQQMSQVAHNTLTSDQKEQKKLVKRITKNVQPLFEEAMRKEAELAGRPYEKLPDLETLLNQKLLRRPSALSVDEGIRQTTESDQPSHDLAEEQIANKQFVDAHDGPDDIQLAPTPDDNPTDPHQHAHDDSTDEAAIAAQLGQDTLHISNGKPRGDAMEAGQEEDNSRTEPLTPPRSEKNLLNPLGNGGIPWYLETFDIHGTTVYEERYTGREVLRDMSEELSELDDDILDGLADSDPVRSADATDATPMDIQKAAARKKQRRRGYR